MQTKYKVGTKLYKWNPESYRVDEFVIREVYKLDDETKYVLDRLNYNYFYLPDRITQDVLDTQYLTDKKQALGGAMHDLRARIRFLRAINRDIEKRYKSLNTQSHD